MGEQERRWSDADRELVKFAINDARYDEGGDEQAAAVLDALADSRRWLRIRVEDLDQPPGPDETPQILARLESEWRQRGWAPVEETRRRVSEEITARADQHAGHGLNDPRTRMRRHLLVAARIAAGPLTDDDVAEIAAQITGLARRHGHEDGDQDG